MTTNQNWNGSTMPSSLHIEFEQLVETLLFDGYKVLEIYMNPKDHPLGVSTTVLSIHGFTIPVIPDGSVPVDTFEFRARRGH